MNLSVDSHLIDKVTTKKPLGFRECLLSVRSKNQKSFIRQITEILKLHLGPGRLGLREYYYFGLFDDRRFSAEEKRKFCGWRIQRKIGRELFPHEWFAVSADKLLSQSIVSQIGVRVPKVYAVYHPYRHYGGVPTLTTRDGLADYLRQEMIYPFFSKPSWSDLSEGIASVETYDKRTDSLVLAGGNSIPVERFVENAGNAFKSTSYTTFYGHVFQERLTPHSDLKSMTNGCLATNRLILLLTESGPEILFAMWKIPCGNNIADNLARWGNIISVVDPVSGRIERLVRYPGPDMQELTHHPDTGEPVLGRKLPLWQETLDTCIKAAKAFPGIPIQGWDIAITDSGPVAMELNLLGDLNLPQFAYGKGIWQGRFKEFVESLASTGKR